MDRHRDIEIRYSFPRNLSTFPSPGIGKTTLIETLFNAPMGTSIGDHESSGVRLQSSTHRLKESQVDLKLTVVDSVGFGDQVNKDLSWTPIVNYIDEKFEEYLQVRNRALLIFYLSLPIFNVFVLNPISPFCPRRNL